MHSYVHCTNLLSLIMIFIQSMDSVYGSGSLLFFHFKSRTTSTVQVAVLDASAVLAYSEKGRRGDVREKGPVFNSVLTIPLPASDGSRAGDSWVPTSSETIPGSVSVVRVFPLLMSDDSIPSREGSAVRPTSSDSTQLSCSYSVVVCYGLSMGDVDRTVAQCITKYVTAENQVSLVARHRYVVILFIICFRC